MDLKIDGDIGDLVLIILIACSLDREWAIRWADQLTDRPVHALSAVEAKGVKSADRR